MPLSASAKAVQRPIDAKLLVLGRDGRLIHALRADLIRFLRRGDVVVANDAATLPASLGGVHIPSGAAIEVRLAAVRSLRADALRRSHAVVFGAGDFRTRTEHRPPPPQLAPGDGLRLGPLTATVEAILGHPRLVALAFHGSTDEIWAGMASHGRPIQYAHLATPLAVWDVWTPIAGRPFAFETPSAGFALDWRLVAELHRRGIAFATLTHAAGISSTGDPALDAYLPFDEPYAIPESTVRAVRCARTRGGRVVAVGTTVVRALEHAAGGGALRAGEGLATQRIGAGTRLAVVDAIVSGTHVPGSSHYELLRAFADDEVLRRVDAELELHRYRTHEFGDSILIERRHAMPVPRRKVASALAA
jgi:S-adenosylmethionine:tRNA ribosyltransferase-isomerase